MSSIAMIGVDARLLGRQQLVELTVDLGGGPQVAVQDFSVASTRNMVGNEIMP